MLSANYTSQYINKTIAKRGSFDEQRLIADEEKFVSARRAGETSELTILENEIREVLDFQTATANERDKFPQRKNGVI
ncbi:hypothetical protein BOTNAR_0206g00030 [Botryotinia narcissicola]|uniref:Uncharacterized protein n=1 Tax=Botryotinia narcissicola TaxID=278944 RepID=A0A4Z1I6Y8_9HELO|nr:hypothetical protein BOTNAR_0206g00030 [Botryotinia narcissicola]